MSSAAQAYARTAQRTASPREIEAQALLKAARQLQDVVTNWSERGAIGLNEALMFNRKLWSIFVSDAMRDDNPQTLEIRQNIANIGVFVLSQSTALQMAPQVEALNALIEINRNIAAGLSGRA
ncbi:flagellar biosynthesis regulator FlaF [Rhodopseudomonas palustris]|uniref:flagellar biosynthesis regulator FlaF n=1 Tax=Rhodopseudomonas palustris TaxID=1076 RepID=UPI002ACDA7C8|nr:flagellar biosynthesis regulator FlaF [Rhodopseudomonas palustris]WQH01855.1 flagellar biosynthesis regulator FlaF [Rhodopseudomonas palustris]